MQVVNELRQKFAIEDVLKITQMKRSTFYYQLQQLAVTDKYAEIKQHIKAIYDQHKGRYGYRRITTELKNLGIQINHKAVQSLMDVLKLKSLVRPKKYCSYKGEEGKKAKNILKRNFKASAPNKKWVTDITEFKVKGEKLYLSPILDLFNGEIIAYEIARTPAYKMVQNMLDKAYERLGKKDKPILHSDQGWHYQMMAYQESVSLKGIKQSMSRKGNCYDNAAMESFFAVLKTEFFYLNQFESVDQLEEGIKEYIDYYNNDRIKLKLNGKSPVKYRTQFNSAF